MNPYIALVYSFLFGLLHGILPDEHTWPITFSYAIGGGSGKEGAKAGLYFSGAFTFQRMLISELAYLTLAPFLLKPIVNEIVYLVVGGAMTGAAMVVRHGKWYPHLHLIRHRHGLPGEALYRPPPVEGKDQAEELPVSAPPAKWAIVHGFIAGFGFGAFALFVNTVAAPAMPSPWMGFLPGLVFGLGTMLMLIIVGAVFGASLHWLSHSMAQREIQRIGALTGTRTLLFGGLLFILFGIVSILGFDSHLPADAGYLLITVFMIFVAVPAFVYSFKEVRAVKKGLKVVE
jgi:sulfite exporter TauE/SafE